MQKDDKFYTFLLSQFNRTKTYVSQEEISRRIFQMSVASLALMVGIFTILFSGIIKHTLAETELIFQTNPALIAQQINFSPAEYKSINYERPDSPEDFAFHSGGPVSDLTESESEAEEAAIDGQLHTIETTSDPAFLPTMWAHMGKINNEFGYRRNPFGGRGYEFHPGLDIDGERGDTVAAPANGTVTKAGWEGGYGNMIEIDHGNGLVTRYGHLSKIGVQIGDAIARGQLIGLIGSTGRSTGPHLHFEIRFDDKPINPRRFLPPEPPEIKALSDEQR